MVCGGPVIRAARLAHPGGQCSTRHHASARRGAAGKTGRSSTSHRCTSHGSGGLCERAARSDRGGETHHMRTPRATQMARSSISEQPGRSSPMCWPVRCSLATADASRKRRRSTAAALKGQGAASGGTEHWWRSFVPREGSRFDCRTPRALSLRVGGTQRRRDTAWPVAVAWSTFRTKEDPMVGRLREHMGNCSTQDTAGKTRVRASAGIPLVMAPARRAVVRPTPWAACAPSRPSTRRCRAAPHSCPAMHGWSPCFK